MRTLFGIVLGIALTFGAAFFHDNNIPANSVSPNLTERPIVNWEVLGAVLREDTSFIRGLWGGDRAG
jgi:hypothetical protein